MKNKVLFPVILFAGILFVTISLNQAYGQTQPKNKQVAKETVKYTCPMHPEIIKNKPDKCPKCGMELVVKKNNKKSEMMGDSTMMKKDHTKMMHDTTSMKKRRHDA